VTSVERSLTAVNGVTRAEVSLEKAEAVVTFDDTKTSVDALHKATKAAGYPSVPRQKSK
jgi:periplasmic mercuric ion binding protein